MASLDPTSTGTASEKMVADYLGGTAANPVSVPVSGLTGATAASRYVGATTTGIPTTGTFAVGDYVLGQTEGAFYICTVAGSPGTWKNAARDPLMDALGLKSWNAHPFVFNSSIAATSQTLYALAVPTTAGQTYVGVKLTVTVAGTSTAPTSFFVGLATQAAIGAAGTMLAQSSDLSATSSLTTTGIQSFPFNATYTETVTGLRMVLFTINGVFSGTNVVFMRQGTTAANSTAPFSATAGTTVTALASNGSAVAANYSTSGNAGHWVALY